MKRSKRSKNLLRMKGSKERKKKNKKRRRSLLWFSNLRSFVKRKKRAKNESLFNWRRE
jgi:hypothetical protein